MQNVQQKPQRIKALIYKPQRDGSRLLVHARDVTDWPWERMAKFAKDLDCQGREYEIMAT